MSTAESAVMHIQQKSTCRPWSQNVCFLWRQGNSDSNMNSQSIWKVKFKPKKHSTIYYINEMNVRLPLTNVRFVHHAFYTTDQRYFYCNNAFDYPKLSALDGTWKLSSREKIFVRIFVAHSTDRNIVLKGIRKEQRNQSVLVKRAQNPLILGAK